MKSPVIRLLAYLVLVWSYAAGLYIVQTNVNEVKKIRAQRARDFQTTNLLLCRQINLVKEQIQITIKTSDRLTQASDKLSPEEKALRHEQALNIINNFKPTNCGNLPSNKIRNR